MVGSRRPVNFFAYPGRRSLPLRADTTCLTLAAPGQQGCAALESLCELIGADAVPTRALAPRLGRARGAITAESLAVAVGRHLPEQAIVCDEAVTAGCGLAQASAAAAPHDWLDLIGGAIGGALPLSTGAREARCRYGDLWQSALRHPRP